MTRTRTHSRSLFGTLAAALTVACMTAPSLAGHNAGHTSDPNTEVNYDNIGNIGSIIANGTLKSDFQVGGSNEDIGDLTVNVYFNSTTQLYTYELNVLPAVQPISEFATAFLPNGWNGVAGWSYSDAAAAGGDADSNAFAGFVDASSPSIDWEAQGAFWNSGETITFFFQSTLPPATDRYNIANHVFGTTTNLAPGEDRGGGGQEPIPAPAAFPAGLALLALCGALRRRYLA